MNIQWEAPALQNVKQNAASIDTSTKNIWEREPHRRVRTWKALHVVDTKQRLWIPYPDKGDEVTPDKTFKEIMTNNKEESVAVVLSDIMEERENQTLNLDASTSTQEPRRHSSYSWTI